MKRAKNMVDEDDTINKLDDDLLRHIIGLLPIKDALRTSVLSSRWRNIWRSISNIDLNDFSFPSKEAESFFLDSIDRLLVYHDTSDIKKFNSCNVNIDGPRIVRWISEAINHNVEELRVGCDLYLDKSCILPLWLFKSESLTVLEIDFAMDSIVLGSSFSLFSVQLPSLKRLKLSGIYFLNNHSAQQFFSNIPKLQQLCLYDCNWEKVNFLTIDIPTLEGIDVCIGHTHNNLDCRVLVIAPSLTYLNCSTDFCIDFLVSNHRSLSLNMILDAPFHVHGERLALIRFLESVKQLMSLNVTWDFIRWLNLKGIAAKDLPLFMNLTQLEITTDRSCSYGGVNLEKFFMFLHKTPNLQSLTITLPDWTHEDWMIFGGNFEYDWSSDDVPSCVIYQKIKNFTISSKFDVTYSLGDGVSEYSTAMSFIKYFMNHSRSLEILEVIGLCYPCPVQDVIDEIQRHPRFSELKDFLCSVNI